MQKGYGLQRQTTLSWMDILGVQEATPNCDFCYQVSFRYNWLLLSSGWYPSQSSPSLTVHHRFARTLALKNTPTHVFTHSCSNLPTYVKDSTILDSFNCFIRNLVSHFIELEVIVIFCQIYSEIRVHVTELACKVCFYFHPLFFWWMLFSLCYLFNFLFRFVSNFTCHLIVFYVSHGLVAHILVKVSSHITYVFT